MKNIKEWFKTDTAKLLIRAWVAGMALITFWGVLNIWMIFRLGSGASRPFDVTWGIVVIISQVYLLKGFSTAKINPTGRWIALIISLLSIGVGLGYLQTEGGLREFAYLVNQADLQFGLFVYSLQAKNFQVVVQFIKLVLLWGILVLLAEIIGIALLLIFDFLTALFKIFSKVSSKVRWGRIYYWAKRVLLAGIMVFFVWLLFPLVFTHQNVNMIHKNTYIPSYPRINALVVNNKTGYLYAGTNTGVFRLSRNNDIWEKISNGMAERGITALEIGNDGELLFAATYDGLFKSENEGETWKKTSLASDLTSEDYISVKDVLFAQDKKLLFALTYDGFYYSNDLGETWIQSTGYAGKSSLSHLAYDSEKQILYSAGGYSEDILISLDEGKEWASSGRTPGSVNDIYYDVNSSALYIATDRGFYSSVDSTNTWIQHSANQDFNAFSFGSTNNVIYAGTSDQGVFISNGEKNWATANDGLFETAVYTFAFDSYNNTLFAGTSNGVFRKKLDSDSSWEFVGEGMEENNSANLALDAETKDLYAYTENAIFRSTNHGESWSLVNAGLPNVSIYYVAYDAVLRNMTVVTDGGVFYWQETEKRWLRFKVFEKNIERILYVSGIRKTYALSNDQLIYSSTDGRSWELVTNKKWADFDEQLDTIGGNIIFSAPNLEIMYSTDQGTTWLPISGLPEPRNYMIDFILYTENRGYCTSLDWYGIYCSENGENWKLAGNKFLIYSTFDHWYYGGELTDRSGFNVPNSKLIYEPNKRNLYLGTNQGLYVLPDSANTWSETILTNVKIIDLAFDDTNKVFYASTEDGILSSRDLGESWNMLSGFKSGSASNDLLYDSAQSELLAITDDRVFTSTDYGSTWINSSFGLPDDYFYVWMYLPHKNMVYISCWDGVYQSADFGKSWNKKSPAIVGFENRISNFYYDGKNEVLYAENSNHLLFELKSDSSWHPLKSMDILKKIIKPEGAIINSTEGRILIANDGLEKYIKDYYLETPYIKMKTDAHGQKYLVNLDNTSFTVSELPKNFITFSGFQIVASIWVKYQLSNWLNEYGSKLLSALLISLSFIAATNYFSSIRHLGVSFPNYMMSGSKMHQYASVKNLSYAWQDWQKLLHYEITQFGNVLPSDLLGIPAEFRQYAIVRYFEEFGSKLLLEKRGEGLHLLTGDRLKKWHSSWQIAQREVGTRSGLMSDGKAAVNTLADVLCGLLGFNLKEPRELNNALAFQVEAPVLRMRLPSRFPLIFIADQQPGETTVQNLVDVVDLYQSNSYFALVVVLESANRTLDLPSELRRLVSHSPHAKDFIILSNENIINILISRGPVQELAQSIAKQVDLSFISPFVIAGPVPENMFFGRETEIRNILDGLERGNFALVGNRKVGKTSLLKRVVDKVKANERFLPIWMDCQTVRNADGFYELFGVETGVQVKDLSAFTGAVNQMKRGGHTPVFILDEVDALLWEQKKHGEILTANWRALAQADTCRFIFCGSTGLARFLDDPNSPMFNFPQSLPLGYLNRETTDFVITQPFETLGVNFENRSAVLDAIWNLTSGHPNLVQYVGNSLVQVANKRDTRAVSADDVQQLDQSDVFTDYFLKTLWGEIGPLEKIITLLASTEGTTLSQLEEAFQRIGVKVSDEMLDVSMKMLRVYSLMQKVNRTYQFIPRAFPEILHRTQDVERLIRIEKERYTREQS